MLLPAARDYLSLLCHQRVQLGRVGPVSPCPVLQELGTFPPAWSPQPVLGRVGILETSLSAGSRLDLCGGRLRLHSWSWVCFTSGSEAPPSLLLDSEALKRQHCHSETVPLSIQGAELCAGRLWQEKSVLLQFFPHSCCFPVVKPFCQFPLGVCGDPEPELPGGSLVARAISAWFVCWAGSCCVLSSTPAMLRSAGTTPPVPWELPWGLHLRNPPSPCAFPFLFSSLIDRRGFIQPDVGTPSSPKSEIPSFGAKPDTSMVGGIP